MGLPTVAKEEFAQMKDIRAIEKRAKNFVLIFI
jgi:hypothetical protein